MSILNPEPRLLESILEKDFEMDGGFNNKHLYMSCVDRLRKMNLRDISEKEINGPFTVFLINWGKMDRYLNRKGLKDTWRKNLLEKIRENADRLEQLRRIKLWEVDLEKFKSDVECCYDSFASVIKFTAAGKSLHLICPDFFPLWDSYIRQALKKVNRGINESKEGYYNFMKTIREFVLTYKDILFEMVKEKYKTTVLKLVDIYLWSQSKK